jgi:hypothetical protein
MKLTSPSNLFILFLAVVFVPSCATAQSSLPPTGGDKKLIEFGWDTPSPQALHDHVTEWQGRPFDGVIFSLSDNAGMIFNIQAADSAKIRPQIALLNSLHWGRFTDNFLELTCTSTMNWTSDSDWKIVLNHAHLCAEAARAAGCKGFVLDPEPYNGLDPWNYQLQQQSKTMTFAEYQEVVRHRGSEFIEALQQNMPDMKLMSFYQYSELVNESGRSQDPAVRERALEINGYGLLPAFLDGMLESADPRVQFIDGNERSYYYRYKSDFENGYYVMHSVAPLYVTPELRSKYNKQFRSAQAVYTDFNFDLRPDAFPSIPSVSMTPAQRDQIFESNLYYALKTSDEYVWLYSETVHWWDPATPRPPGMEQAISDAVDKVRSGQPLGFSTSSIETRARFKSLLARIGL